MREAIESSKCLFNWSTVFDSMSSNFVRSAKLIISLSCGDSKAIEFSVHNVVVDINREIETKFCATLHSPSALACQSGVKGFLCIFRNSTIQSLQLTMKKNRLEAFSDGVFAIIITIMVLELKTPHDDHVTALKPLFPIFLSYVLSFIYVGIYWNNHHHLWHIVEKVDGKLLWANLHLLFWLSLLPFATGWMGENHFAAWPVALYGFVLLMAGIAWTIMARLLIGLHGANSDLAKAYGKDAKGRISLVIYVIAMFVSLLSPWIGFSLYSVVALMWIPPDPRIERLLKKGD